MWLEVENGGLKIVKNGPRVWAFCKIEFPGIQKPVQILTQKSSFFKKCGNRGVGVIWLVRGFEFGLLGFWLLFCFVDGCLGIGLVFCISLAWLLFLLVSFGRVWIAFGWRVRLYRY